MESREEQIKRIRREEALFDEISRILQNAQSALEKLENERENIAELTAYYESEDWKKDFADDEAGLLPPDLKRGVLSEDGVYDLLEEICALSGERNAPAGEELTVTITVKTRGEVCEMREDEIARLYETRIAELFHPGCARPQIEAHVERKPF